MDGQLNRMTLHIDFIEKDQILIVTVSSPLTDIWNSEPHGGYLIKILIEPLFYTNALSATDAYNLHLPGFLL
jgi:hypothetical protein